MDMSEKTNLLSSVKDVLNYIRLLQSAGDSVYPKGLFPSQRSHPCLPYRREDDNLFFTASIVHIIQTCYAQLTPAEQLLATEISEASVSTFHLFRNKDGLDTYNFWQTKPSRHFPNGYFMHRFKHFQIPDDVDDTALVYLIENADAARVDGLRHKLKQHANLSYKRAFNPLKKYQGLKCYSTFFGKQMYIEFDICVLSNLMRVILKHVGEDELNEYDHDTLRFVTEVVINGEHISAPFYSAPNYPTTELILYHVARLMPVMPSMYREKIEIRVKQDIVSRLQITNGMNRILLENAAMKLSIPFENVEFEHDSLLKDNSFYFFHAGMITAFENHVAQRLADHSLFHLRYTSKALNGALLIENMVLKRKLIP